MKKRYKITMEKSNEEKAKEIAHEYFRRGQLGMAAIDTESAGYDCAMQAMEWKDEQIKAIAEIIADLFGTPFEYTPIDEEMLENEVCENCFNCSDCNCDDALCWIKYFELKYKNKMTNKDGQEDGQE